jgi:hypothetical protein
MPDVGLIRLYSRISVLRCKIDSASVARCFVVRDAAGIARSNSDEGCTAIDQAM